MLQATRGALSAKQILPVDITIERLEELLENVTNDGDCWLKPVNHHTGYTYARIKQTRYGIHRIIKVVAQGKPIPSELVCDHLCRNRNCVNPNHIEVVAQSTNAKRGETGIYMKTKAASTTHCPKGMSTPPRTPTYITEVEGALPVEGLEVPINITKGVVNES